jgi:LuxR family maltose regulon positive regulatory protein
LESVRNLHFALRVETHLATVKFRARKVAEALSSFGGIVTKSARAGICHTILDEGAEVGPLLAAFQENAERTKGSREFMSYVSNLIAAWSSRYQSEPQ